MPFLKCPSRWIIERDDNGLARVSVDGRFLVSDGTDTAAQRFTVTDPWASLPVTVRQAIGEAWTSYRDWLQQRHAAGEI